ncbi:MAG TPA: spore coat protein U domain-containing protein [Arsenophonus sp.]
MVHKLPPARYIINTSANQGVYYGVYDSNTMTTALTNDATINPESTPSLGTNVYSLYGQIIGDNTNTGITTGAYTDVLNVIISY